MHTTLLPCAAELCLDRLLTTPQQIRAVVRTCRSSAICPRCQQVSDRIHSRYQRTVADLPWSGVMVRVTLHTRRFFCGNNDCPQQIFAERLPGTVDHYARRTRRLADALQLLGFAVGGEAGARLARQLGMQTSPDTLLRYLHQTSHAACQTPRVLGVDDWAWKKGLRYGTILVDLERRRVVDLLPDRQAETFAAWLQEHPGVEVISRDRAGAYAEGARQGAPQALQVADRWHLLVNLSESLREMLEHRRPLLRLAAESPPLSLNLCPAEPVIPRLAFERRRLHLAQQSRARRLARYEQVHHFQQQGLSERAIARQLQISRTIVRRFLATNQFPERSARLPRLTPLTPYHDYLHRRWAEGCHNSAQLWRELRTRGYRGQRSSVRDFVASWRLRNEQPSFSPKAALPGQPFSPRWTARLLLQAPEKLTEEQRNFLARLTELDSDVGQAAELGQQFAQIVRERRPADLENWLIRAGQSNVAELHRFAAGLKRDYAAVQSALREPWSNGPVEGQIHRLKLLKRQMYGRGKLDLLCQRLLHAA